MRKSALKARTHARSQDRRSSKSEAAFSNSIPPLVLRQSPAGHDIGSVPSLGALQDANLIGCRNLQAVLAIDGLKALDRLAHAANRAGHVDAVRFRQCLGPILRRKNSPRRQPNVLGYRMRRNTPQSPMSRAEDRALPRSNPSAVPEAKPGVGVGPCRSTPLPFGLAQRPRGYVSDLAANAVEMVGCGRRPLFPVAGMRRGAAAAFGGTGHG